MDGIVVIGEGEKDEAPMLYNGEQIGDGTPPQVDIAVDPLEGTTLAAHGMPSALAVIALSARGDDVRSRSVRVHGEDGRGHPRSSDLLDLDRPLGETVKLVAELARNRPVSDVMVVVLDRPRHTGGHRCDPRGRRACAADRSRGCVRRPARRHRAFPGRPAVGHRRHA